MLVAFGLLNCGLPHARLRSVQRAIDEKRTPGALESVRAYYTNDGDLWRYFAYAQAALGRPYPSYFIRTATEWRQAFAEHEPYRPDETPQVTPTGRLVPYRDFLVEYPPGFFLLVLPIAAVFQTARGFALAFQCLMALALSFALVLATRAVGGPKEGGARRSIAPWAALATLLLGVVTTHRFDAAVAFVLALGAWAFVTERPVVLGLAASAALLLKGVPLIAFPPVIMVWLSERRYRDVGLSILTALVASIAVLTPLFALAGPAAFETARYHAVRPVQLESTWGALMGLAHAIRPGLVTVEKTFGSTNTTGPLGSILAPVSTSLTIIGLVIVYVATWRRLRGLSPTGRRGVAVQGLLASLVVFMALGKVCSPQYLVWLLPLGLAASRASPRGKVLALLLATFALTQAIYPVSYGAVEHLRPWALGLVLTRNLLLATWAVLMMRLSPRPA